MALISKGVEIRRMKCASSKRTSHAAQVAELEWKSLCETVSTVDGTVGVHQRNMRLLTITPANLIRDHEDPGIGVGSLAVAINVIDRTITRRRHYLAAVLPLLLSIYVM